MERRALSDEIRTNNQHWRPPDRVAEHPPPGGNHPDPRRNLRRIITTSRPFTIISGFIQIINQRIINNDRVRGEDLDMVPDRLKRITRQVSNCIEISQRYLSFMRQDSREVKVRLNRFPMTLGELMKAHPGTEKNDFASRIHPTTPMSGSTAPISSRFFESFH